MAFSWVIFSARTLASLASAFRRRSGSVLLARQLNHQFVVLDGDAVELVDLGVLEIFAAS